MAGPWANGLSVGDVAGILAAVISVAALIIIALVSKGKHTAATWSVASRAIQGSLWPWLLQGDGSVTKHLPWSIIIYSSVVTVAMLLLIPVHFFTPLPLVPEIRSVKTLQNVTFSYMPDTSFIGLRTPQRTANSITRLCTHGVNNTWTNCPHSDYTAPAGTSAYFRNQKIVNATIPLTTSALFASDENSTIAGPMDIQFRNLLGRMDSYIDGNAPQLIGGLLSFQSFLLGDSYHLIEGVIVDSKDGGIGLRNHSMPNDLDFGGSWSEDILWITPVTSCTDTNLTFGHLRDDGGFADLASEPPGPSWAKNEGANTLWNISGPVPDLQSRAAQAAWWNNLFIKEDLGIESPIQGQIYYNNNSFYNYTWENRLPNAIEISPMNGAFLNTTLFGQPLKFDAGWFDAYGVRCGGYIDGETIDPSKPYIRCGYLYGVPQPAEPGDWTFNLESRWTQSLYTCASATKTSVKTVHFESSGTSSLEYLQVVSVVDKDYAESAEPLWGVENLHNYNVEGIDLFWGPIKEAVADSPDLWVRRTPEIYLPVSTADRMAGYWLDGFAAGSAFTTAWNTVYTTAAGLAGCGILGIPSYSGETNYEMTLKYRTWTNSTDGAAHLLNLIWTDLAAWSVVGTKTGFEGQASSRSSGSIDSASILGIREVYPHKQGVRYQNMLYAIPAMIAAGLWLFLVLSVLLLCCGYGARPKIRWRMLNHHVNQTGMGRVATNAMHRAATTGSTYIADYDPVARTKDWTSQAGQLELDVPPWAMPRKPRMRHHKKKSSSSHSPSSSRTLPSTAQGSGDWELPSWPQTQTYQQLRPEGSGSDPLPPRQHQRWRLPFNRQLSLGGHDYQPLRDPAVPVELGAQQPHSPADGFTTRFGSLHRTSSRSLPSQRRSQGDAESEEVLL